MSVNDNPRQSLAFEFLQNTGENLFLTGRAGTGKTTFLHYLKRNSPKRMVVLAPTGVAALNAGGVTIHSFFQLPFGPQLPGSKTTETSKKYHRFNREKLNIIKSLDLVVIDEISMVRADLLDGIDEVLRRLRDRSKPFGGVQLLMIGDLQQLAPVVKDDEWELLKDHYHTPFFFGSKALQESTYVTIELQKVYRQSDQTFINLLNNVRHGQSDPQTLEQLNKRYLPDFSNDKEGGIILTTHNYQAQKINTQKMESLKTAAYSFKATIEGDFPEFSYPTEFDLTLKTGAQVMFVKNDSSPNKRYFNGRIGTVQDILKGTVYVRCPGDVTDIEVTPEIWHNMKYSLNNKGDIDETIKGTFTQYPLKAAWAITIHKSQGLTFNKVIIDAGAAFAHGQVYVALSRCKTLEGLVLTTPLSSKVLISSSSVSKFNSNVLNNPPDTAELQRAKIKYQRTLLFELFDFRDLKRKLNYCLKIIKDHQQSIQAVTIELIEQIAAQAESEIITVANKFMPQISAYLSQEADTQLNSALQQRVKKASLYFSEKIEHCFEQLPATNTLDIDNREVLKSVSNLLTQIHKEVEKKGACFKACSEGFVVSTFLQARAKSEIEKPGKKSSSGSIRKDQINSSHPELYLRLKEWRDKRAESADLPHYMILPYKTISEISSRMPSSLNELKKIKGVGAAKLKNFGEELLKVIDLYADEHNIPYEKRDEPFVDETKKPLKRDTKQISFDLFKTGKTIEQIASQRGLTHSTIEGHLAHFISTGELGVESVIASEDVAKISEFFLSQNSRQLNPAREHFGQKYSYGALRMVVAHLQNTREDVFS
ncbi:helix-turn-helix domain-containing protein [Chitinispirillales bacterium ANBcel5]|uniref:helix-turn-helix domain-containing protein n=1 Tax=Cellulosispirillum alkaliphilum TaxID=3039283 RepID=UPI002A581246|nr:helix-turn-helix domain-containing protein [Chitinispirillales bacterium ANBcel5]